MSNLKVWWNPQLGVVGQPFEVEVSTVAEGVKILQVLANYDSYQYDNNIKPDYCNIGGLLMLENGEWYDWYDYDTDEGDPEVWLKDQDVKI